MIHHTNTRILEKIKKNKNPFFAKKPTKKSSFSFTVLYVHFTPHIFIPFPLLRTTFSPFPRPLWVAHAHPEQTGASLDSPKANAPRGTGTITSLPYCGFH